MNIKKNSFMVLGLVFGISVILYIFDVPITSSSSVLIPTVFVPTAFPTTVPIMQATPIPSLKHLSETINYSVRGIPESITVNITVNGTTVTDLQLSQNTDNGQSAAYQDAFQSEVKPSVVGKNIKDINVSRISGASYTTDAFMQAIDKIKAQI